MFVIDVKVVAKDSGNKANQVETTAKQSRRTFFSVVSSVWNFALDLVWLFAIVLFIVFAAYFYSLHVGAEVPVISTIVDWIMSVFGIEPLEKPVN